MNINGIANMETRNFYILVATVCVGLTVFWLSMYNFARLGIDPIEHASESFTTIFEGEQEDDETIVKITGNVKKELKLSLSDIKSSKYVKVTDKKFKVVTREEPHYYIYSGASLWSILEVEDILESDASTFLFIGKDGYESPLPLDLALAEQYEKDVILAYEFNGDPLYEQGPIRSVVDHEVVEDIEPEQYSSQYSVQNLVEVRIE